MMTTTLTLQANEILHIESATNRLVVVSAARAEEIIAARKSQGWKVWREVRDSAGALLDCLLTISI